MNQKYFTRAGAIIALFYIGWFVYERFTCINCWGNDIFFSIPAIALVPASFENSVIAKYIVVLINASLIDLVIYYFGKGITYASTKIPKSK